MAEKYYSYTPYAYCAGNPVNLVDPEGTHIWGLTPNGCIVLISESDEEHILIVLDEKKYTTNLSLSMDSDSVFESLQGGTGLSSYLGQNNETEILLKLFFFVSDNSSAEWALHWNENQVVIGTKHSNDSVGNWESLGLSERPSFSIHSHPGIQSNPIDEYFSLGMQPVDSQFKCFHPIIGSDWVNMQTMHEKMADNYIIYFPISGNFYRLGYPNKVAKKSGLFKQYR